MSELNINIIISIHFDISINYVYQHEQMITLTTVFDVLNFSR